MREVCFRQLPVLPVANNLWQDDVAFKADSHAFEQLLARDLHNRRFRNPIRVGTRVAAGAVAASRLGFALFEPRTATWGDRLAARADVGSLNLRGTAAADSKRRKLSQRHR